MLFSPSGVKITYIKSGLTQATDFFPFVDLFSPGWAKKDLHKEGKYHAAAGYNRICVSPKNIKTILPQAKAAFCEPRCFI
jgi:hypothetical protein